MSVDEIDGNDVFTQVGIDEASDQLGAWYAQFTGIQIGVFKDYELTGEGKRTGFCHVRIGGGQGVRARLNWSSDGLMAGIQMPIPSKTLVVIGFLTAQARTRGEAVVVGFANRQFFDVTGSPAPEVDDIFQTAQPGEHIIQSRWVPSGTVGAKTDKMTLLYLKADGAVEVTVDKTATNPLKLTLDAQKNVTLENVNTLKATSAHATIECPDVNLGGNSGAPVIRKVDFPIHIDPSTGAPIQAFQWPTSSAKVKSE